MQLPNRSIREVRAELKIWGNYWYGKEQLSGYASRSACDKLGEVMTNSDAHLYERALTPPPIVQAYDRRSQAWCQNVAGRYVPITYVAEVVPVKR